MMKVDWLAAGDTQIEVSIVLVIFPLSWHIICQSSRPIGIKIQFLAKSLKPADQHKARNNVLKTTPHQHYYACSARDWE